MPQEDDAIAPPGDGEADATDQCLLGVDDRRCGDGTFETEAKHDDVRSSGARHEAAGIADNGDGPARESPCPGSVRCPTLVRVVLGRVLVQDLVAELG